MRSRVDRNEVMIQGRVLYSKAWPPKPGKKFSSGTVTLRAGVNDYRISVFLGEKDLSEFEKVFELGRTVVVSNAHFSTYQPKPKDGRAQPLVFQIEAKLTGSYQATGTDTFTNAWVSGKLTSEKEGRGIVESFYFLRGKAGEGGGTLEKRLVRIATQNGITIAGLTGKHLLMTGELTTIPERGPYILPHKISVSE